MTQENKYRVERGLKVFGLVIWAVLTIAVCSFVWNANPGAFFASLAGALLLANILAIVCIFRSLPTPEIEDPHFENPIDLTRKK